MALSERDKRIRKLKKKTVEKMKMLKVYKSEFDDAISMYCDLLDQYQEMNKKFIESGSKITESYTNKAGATNIRKSAIYLALESLRKDVLNYQNILGLTPSGLKKINDELANVEEEAALEKALAEYG